MNGPAARQTIGNEKSEDVAQSSQRMVDAYDASPSEGSTEISSQQILAMSKEKQEDGKQSTENATDEAAHTLD